MSRTGLLLTLGLVSLAAAWAGLRLARGFRMEWGSFHPRAGAARTPPGLERVALQAPGGPLLRGLWRPGHNGAALVLLHGSEATAESLTGEAEAFAARGFAVLLYDAPGHGASGGAPDWGPPFEAALEAAVEWLVQQPGQARARIGVVGYSTGAFTAALAGPRLSGKVGAMALYGGFADTDDLMAYQAGSLGRLGVWGGQLAWKLSGFEPRRPADAVGQFAPGALLVLAGERDAVVAPALQRALFEAAREPKEFALLPGAGHEGGAAAASRMADFFERALLRP